MDKSFDEYLTWRILSVKHQGSNDALLESVLEGSDFVGIPTRNVCAKISEKLAKELDSCVSLLGISKRKFIETALIEALRRVDEIAAQYQLYEHLAESSSGADFEKKKVS